MQPWLHYRMLMGSTEARTSVATTPVTSAQPARPGSPGPWVLLCYRLPREPSTPRIGVWRRLERLGVARLGDGLVALPADARTREQLDWLAEEIVEAGGGALGWAGPPRGAPPGTATPPNHRPPPGP